MKELQLYTGEITLIDDEDYEWLSTYKLFISNKRYNYVSLSIKTNGKWGRKDIHQLIMKTPKGMYTDHIDGNGLNNQKKNLRIVTNSQNCMNRISQKKTSSIYKGVSWHKKNNKWLSNICINKKRISIGYFDNEKDAAKAYNEKAKELFGKYVKLNEV